MGFRFVEKEIEFGFGTVLSFYTSDFAEVEFTGYDCEHVINGLLFRTVLKVLAIRDLKSNPGDYNVPDDDSKIDSVVTWNADGYIVRLAWIEQEGTSDD